MTQIENQRLKRLISSFKTNRIAVIGDLILDVYVWGSASRISQEAPVPVVHVNKKTERLGGAANVMCNIVTLGAEAYAYGVTGKDLYSDEIKRLMKEFNINYSGVFIDKERATTMKQRVIAASQQLVRIDYEDLGSVGSALKIEITEKIKQVISDKEVDAVIFEDYAKGMLDSEMAADITKAAQDAGVLIALDPHPGHPLDISGITIMTPNKSEAFGLAGIYHPDKNNESEEIEKAALAIQKKWDPDYLLITLGAAGMALFSKGEKSVIIPTRAREVFDVSGAGDTVIATFTLAMLSGATPLEAAEIANHAAGVVVGKVGTVSVSKEELLNSF